MATFDHHGMPIAYMDEGGGQPVLLLHCSAFSGTEWCSLAAALRDRFRVVAPDQWGCGGTPPWPGTGPFTLVAEAAPIVSLMDRIAEPVHLVGHSYGGALALRIARERPDALRSLTLVEPSAFHLLKQGGAIDRLIFSEIAAVAAAVDEAVLSGDLHRGTARFVGYWNGPDAWETTPPEARARLVRRLTKVALDFRALFEEPARLDAFSRIGVPTLLLRGDRSPGPSRCIVELLAGAMPAAAVAVIPGAGHMSPVTHADAVNALIARHLSAASTSFAAAA